VCRQGPLTTRMQELQLGQEDARLAISLQLSMARLGRSTLFPYIGSRKQFIAWDHYPRNDVVDVTGSWQFYYHAHDSSKEGGARHPREHGHIHLFRRSSQGALSHLAGLALDSRGTPLCWFTTNQWVTGEKWKVASALARDLETVQLQVRGPLAGAAKWLAAMVRAYAEPLRETLKGRDRALALHCSHQKVSPKEALTDRNISVWSEFALDWPRDAVALSGQVSIFEK
jgi:hypothetical protein